jgi:hypothetical protein
MAQLSPAKTWQSGRANLGYWITRDGVMPLNKKVKAINNLSRSTNRTEVRKFVKQLHMMPNTESSVTLFDQLIKSYGGSINLGVKRKP